MVEEVPRRAQSPSGAVADGGARAMTAAGAIGAAGRAETGWTGSSFPGQGCVREGGSCRPERGRAGRDQKGAGTPRQRVPERATDMGKAAQKILKNIRATRAAVQLSGAGALTVHLPDHIDVKAIHRRLQMSQAAFAAH